MWSRAFEWQRAWASPAADRHRTKDGGWLPALGLEEYLLSGRPAVVYSAALALFGAQLLSLGFLSELLVAETNRRAREYSIKEEIKAPQEDAKE